jgi:IclR family mhp operon transcriptional activator
VNFFVYNTAKAARQCQTGGVDRPDSPIRALSRGIDVLRAISQRGPLSLSEAMATTGLAHTTVVRIVRTLEADGLIRRIDGTRRYAVTELALGLSCGFTDDDRLAACASGPIRALTAAIGWPVAVLTRVGGSMIVRDSSVRETSLTFEVYDPGVSMPIFGCAAGRAWFAFSDPAQREEMLRHARLAHPDAPEPAIDDDGAAIRRAGHAVLAGMTSDERLRGNAAIAVPVNAGNRLRGVLSLVFFRRAVPLPRAVAEFAAPLARAAEEVGAALAESGAQASGRRFRTA